jgi:transposase
MKNEHLIKINHIEALALANAGYSNRAIGETFGASHVAAYRAIQRAVRAGGVLKKPRKISAEEFADYTVRIWRAKQATMKRPYDTAAREELRESLRVFSEAM